jgi:nitroimidazol reductase NimA-like FMN-containing flavoprotein (pyridoxamine 5'-phosphate oxidase superfamily)
MAPSSDPREALEAIVRANQFMVLATADDEGVPWATPVWFATVNCREYFWVSSPDVRHSRNLAVRPELAMSIYDSQQAPLTGLGVYVAATAVQVPDSELDAGLEVYSEVSRQAGMTSWERSSVLPPAKHRLYRATATELFVLASNETRTSVPLQ